jgi:hypothetical protein
VGGEKMKKIIVIPVFLLAFALISIPVMAKPATKKEVTAAMDVGRSTTSVSVVGNGVAHISGTSAGWFNLTIEGESTPQNFTWAGEWALTMKGFPPPNPDGWTVIMGKVLLTYEGADKTGTFEGTVHKKATGIPPPTATNIWSHMVFQGTEDFQGQTLKLSFDGVPPEAPVGYIIMPK